MLATNVCLSVCDISLRHWSNGRLIKSATKRGLECCWIEGGCVNQSKGDNHPHIHHLVSLSGIKSYSRITRDFPLCVIGRRKRRIEGEISPWCEGAATQPVAQRQYVVSDSLCPALHDCEFWWEEAGQGPWRGLSPVEHRGTFVHPSCPEGWFESWKDWW